MADSCHLDFLKKDQLFSLAILAYHITSLPKAIYEKKSNVIFRRLKSRCDFVIFFKAYEMSKSINLSSMYP